MIPGCCLRSISRAQDGLFYLFTFVPFYMANVKIQEDSWGMYDVQNHVSIRLILPFYLDQVKR